MHGTHKVKVSMDLISVRANANYRQHGVYPNYWVRGLLELHSDRHTLTDIGLGSSHTVALTAAGQVFTWGLNDVGQLGEEGGSASCPRVPMFISRVRISHIAVGSDHTLAQDATGKVCCTT